MVGEADVRSVFFFALRHLHLDAGEQTHQELDDGTDISTGCLEEQCVCACVCVCGMGRGALCMWCGTWGWPVVLQVPESLRMEAKDKDQVVL